MPRYYFDINDGRQVWIDSAGADLANLNEAREQAIALLPDIIRDSPPTNDKHVVECQVKNADGLVVYRGRLTFNETQSGMSCHS